MTDIKSYESKYSSFSSSSSSVTSSSEKISSDDFSDMEESSIEDDTTKEDVEDERKKKEEGTKKKEEDKRGEKTIEVSKELIGLQNGSNYCYLNSTLQMLINIPALMEIVLSIDTSIKSNDSEIENARQVVREIQKTFVWKQQKQREKKPVFSNKSRQKIAEILFPETPREQHDANEVYLKIIDYIEKSILENKEYNEISDEKIKQYNKFREFLYSKKTQTIKRIDNEVEISRQEFSESFLMLDIPNLKENKEISVADYIGNKLKEEAKIEGYKIDNVETEITQIIELTEPSPILFVNLKRFKLEYNNDEIKYTKIKNKSTIPTEITIKDKKYRLFAVQNHNGDLNRGHYTVDINKGIINEGKDSFVNISDLNIDKPKQLKKSSELPYNYCYIAEEKITELFKKRINVDKKIYEGLCKELNEKEINKKEEEEKKKKEVEEKKKKEEEERRRREEEKKEIQNKREGLKLGEDFKRNIREIIEKINELGDKNIQKDFSEILSKKVLEILKENNELKYFKKTLELIKENELFKDLKEKVSNLYSEKYINKILSDKKISFNIEEYIKFIKNESNYLDLNDFAKKITEKIESDDISKEYKENLILLLFKINEKVKTINFLNDSKKGYYFTGEIKKIEDPNSTTEKITLRRICKKIGKDGEEKFILGGWIEKNENLDATKGAWIYNNVNVFGNAKIQGEIRLISSNKDVNVCGIKFIKNAKLPPNLISIYLDKDIKKGEDLEKTIKESLKREEDERKKKEDKSNSYLDFDSDYNFYRENSDSKLIEGNSDSKPIDMKQILEDDDDSTGSSGSSGSGGGFTSDSNDGSKKDMKKTSKEENFVINSNKLLQNIQEKIKITSPTNSKNENLTRDNKDDSKVNDKLREINNTINEINMKILVSILSNRIEGQKKEAGSSDKTETREIDKLDKKIKDNIKDKIGEDLLKKIDEKGNKELLIHKINENEELIKAVLNLEEIQSKKENTEKVENNSTEKTNKKEIQKNLETIINCEVGKEFLKEKTELIVNEINNENNKSTDGMEKCQCNISFGENSSEIITEIVNNNSTIVLTGCYDPSELLVLVNKIDGDNSEKIIEEIKENGIKIKVSDNTNTNTKHIVGALTKKVVEKGIESGSMTLT